MQKSFILFLIALNMVFVASAATHKHEKHTSKERLKDGVYSPRDAHHMEGGEHHSEFDHEAILGSVKEAEEYDHLSPEEAKKRLAILVLKIDSNKDGFVDRHELKAWILRSFKQLAEEEANDRFEEIDEDDNEKVTWDEYFISVYGMDNESLPNADEEKMIASDKAMFNGADLNKDGFLSPDEYVLFQNPEESPEMLPLVLEQTMQDKDENKDGKIDFKEYLGDSAEHNDKEWLVSEKTKFDTEFDKNSDGVLTGNEVLSWVVPSNDEVATEEVDHLFASSDDDHDDRLSYQEIINNYETFVGSEATDYGEQLENLGHFDDEL